MFVQEASLRLYSLPQKKRKKKKMKRKGWLPFVYTFALAMFIDCALYLKIRQSCFLLCAKHGLSEANPASQRQSVSHPQAVHHL